MRAPEENLAALAANPYPGRGIVLGLNETGKFLVQIYWIMGRSENSRNRVFVTDDRIGHLKTEAADPSKVADPSLIMYDAMLEDRKGHYVVSNGAQTRQVLQLMAGHGACLENSLYHNYAYEPDKPNFTPRITGVCNNMSHPQFGLSILRKSRWGDSCDRFVYTYEDLPEGIGMCMHTYMGDGDPLPAFSGEPYPVPIRGGVNEIRDFFWPHLNEGNRISIAVKLISRDSGQSSLWTTNKYRRVRAAA